MKQSKPAIDYCRDIDCPLKNDCKRYTESSGGWKIYFIGSPRNSGSDCDFFINKNSNE